MKNEDLKENVNTANPNEAHKKILKQSQSIMASSFNMGEHLRNTTQLSAINHHAADEQSTALNLTLNEENVTCETLDNASCCSSLRAVEMIDLDEEDTAEIHEMLLKLKSIGVKIKSVANN